MSETDPDLAGAGLSATGKTADQFTPGEPTPGGYGSPAGPGTGEQEVAGADEQADAGQDAAGDMEGHQPSE